MRVFSLLHSMFSKFSNKIGTHNSTFEGSWLKHYFSFKTLRKILNGNMKFVFKTIFKILQL